MFSTFMNSREMVPNPPLTSPFFIKTFHRAIFINAWLLHKWSMYMSYIFHIFTPGELIAVIAQSSKERRSWLDPSDLRVTHIFEFNDHLAQSFVRNSPRMDAVRWYRSVTRILKIALATQEDLEQPHEEHEGRAAACRGQSGSCERGQRTIATHLEQKRSSVSPHE